MDAKFIMAALRAHHSNAAIVEEVVIKDHLWDERTAEGTPSRRIDALMFDGLQRTAIEVKVTLADWKRDHYRKRAPWMAVTNRFVYAVPLSLYETVADRFGPLSIDVWNCGIWAVDDAGRVKAVRKAQVRPTPEPLPQHVVQALAYRAAKNPRADQSVGGGSS